MTDLDLPALRAVAERATPGPMDVWSIPQIDAVRDMQNMLSPARMLALLDRLEKAEKAADAVAVHATNLTLDNSTLRRDNARLADQRDQERVIVTGLLEQTVKIKRRASDGMVWLYAPQGVALDADEAWQVAQAMITDRTIGDQS